MTLRYAQGQALDTVILAFQEAVGVGVIEVVEDLLAPEPESGQQGLNGSRPPDPSPCSPT